MLIKPCGERPEHKPRDSRAPDEAPAIFVAGVMIPSSWSRYATPGAQNHTRDQSRSLNELDQESINECGESVAQHRAVTPAAGAQLLCCCSGNVCFTVQISLLECMVEIT